LHEAALANFNWRSRANTTILEFKPRRFDGLDEIRTAMFREPALENFHKQFLFFKGQAIGGIQNLRKLCHGPNLALCGALENDVLLLAFDARMKWERRVNETCGLKARWAELSFHRLLPLVHPVFNRDHRTEFRVKIGIGAHDSVRIFHVPECFNSPIHGMTRQSLNEMFPHIVDINVPICVGMGGFEKVGRNI
jgi:hypothetical protein